VQVGFTVITHLIMLSVSGEEEAELVTLKQHMYQTSPVNNMASFIS